MSNTDKNGDEMVGKVLDIIDDKRTRYVVAQEVAALINREKAALLDELINGYTLSEAGVTTAVYHDEDEEFIAVSTLKAKRAKLTKKGEDGE